MTTSSKTQISAQLVSRAKRIGIEEAAHGGQRMIPRRIHYCWFGGAEKPDLVQFCLRSWHEHCAGYEIVEWNEENFLIEAFPIAATAYKLKKYAFVSDVVRAYALYTHGGVYVDADVEIRRSFDRFLIHSAFTGFEKRGFPFTAVWGSVQQHKLAEMILDYYSQADAQAVIGVPNTVFVRDILEDHFGVNPNDDELQNCAEGLVVYPSNVFCADLPENYATHHFAGSWLERQSVTHYSDLVLASFYSNSLKKLVSNGIRVSHEGLRVDREMAWEDIAFVSNWEQVKWHAYRVCELISRASKRRMRSILKGGRA
jgi:hypothetical protein